MHSFAYAQSKELPRNGIVYNAKERNSQTMPKDPFYFAKNNIPLLFDNGKFFSSDTGYGFGFGFMEGEMSDDGKMDMLPLVQIQFLPTLPCKTC